MVFMMIPKINEVLVLLMVLNSPFERVRVPNKQHSRSRKVLCLCSASQMAAEKSRKIIEQVIG